MIIQTKVIGINIFQPNLIIWSYLYLGNVALNHKKLNIKIDDFNISHIVPGIIDKYDPIKLLGEIGDNHPPKNITTHRNDTRIMFAYSAKKNNANLIPLYST